LEQGELPLPLRTGDRTHHMLWYGQHYQQNMFLDRSVLIIQWTT